MVVYSSDERAEGNGISHDMDSDDLLNVDDELIIPPFEGYDDDDVQIYEDDDDTQIYKDEDDDETRIYKEESEDDDDDDDDGTNSYKDREYKEENDRKALTYLYRYEHMVRQQEAEDEATARHLKPLFYRLCVLGKMDEEISKIHVSPEFTVVRSNEKNKQLVEKIDNCEVSNLLSYKAMKKALHFLDNTALGGNEYLTTDTQLMLVIRELSESYDDQNESDNDGMSISGDFMYRQALRKRALTFPEFLHCYKSVINGMMALQMFPHPDSVKGKKDSDLGSIASYTPSLSEETESGNKNELPKGIIYHRSRTKERSLSMLRLYCQKKKEKRSIQPKQPPAPLPVPPTPPKKESKSDELVVEMRKIIASKDRQIEELTTKVLQEVNSDDQSVVSARSGKSFISLSLKNRNAKKSSKNTSRKSNYLEEIDDLHKRRVVYGIIFCVAFAVWFIGAFFVVRMMKTPSVVVTQTQPLEDDSLSLQNINEHYILKEEYIDLEETMQTSLKSITHLEREQNINLKQITKLQVTIEKMESDCKTTTAKLATNIEKCNADLQFAQNDAKEHEESLLMLNNKLEMCETQVVLLEPNVQLSEEERRLVFEVHNRMTRNKKRRKQILTVFAGAAGAIIAPHFFNLLGYIGSSIKIVDLVGAQSVVYVWKIPWLNVFKFPFMGSFFGQVGGAMKVLRTGILKLGL